MKLPFKTLWSEFKAFAFKGNMLELAVAVVIGAAFSGVVNSLVKDIIMPSVSYATTAASSASRKVGDITHGSHETPGVAPAAPAAPAGGAAPAAAPAPAGPTDSVEIPLNIGRLRVGNFIGALLNFIIVAFAVFLLVVKFLGSVLKKVNRSDSPAEPLTKECPECLSNIPYKARRCAHCTAVLTTTT